MGHGQSSLEFLFASGLMVLIFTIATVLYYQSSMDARGLGNYAESQRICHEAASQISAVASAGEGTSAVFRMPGAALAQNYTIYAYPQNRSLSVPYGGTVAGCALGTSNVRGALAAAGAPFNITADSPIRNVGGGVVIG